MATISNRIGFKYRHAIRVPNLDTVFFYIRAGLGLAILDKAVIRIYEKDVDYLDLPTNLGMLSGMAAYKTTSSNPYTALFAHIIESQKDFFKGRWD